MNEPRQPVPPPLHPRSTPPIQPHAPASPGMGHPQQPLRPAAPHPPPQRAPAGPGMQPASPGVRPGITPIPTMKPPVDDLEPIALIEEDEPAPVSPGVVTQGHQPAPAPPAPKKIIAFGADGHRAHHDWKRQPVKTGTGACRVRSFHGKYSEQGLEYLDNAINEWLDGHPEIEVKFVTSTVMTFEGKVREPALVLNIWY